MKARILGATLALALGSVSAHAADAINWTGFYAGVNAGYGYGGDPNVHTVGQAAPNIANIAGGARPGFVSLDRKGAIGGIQGGYNFQSDRLLIGGVVDVSYTDLSDKRNIGTVALNGVDHLNNRFESKLDYLGTARIKVGYAGDRFLVYLTGGFAWGKAKADVDMFGAAGQTQFSGHRDRTSTGGVGGVGGEYALTDHLSLEAELLRYSLGTDKVNVAVIPGSGGAGTGYDSRFKHDGSIARVGLNYKF